MSLADMYEKIAAYDEQIEEEYNELSDVEKTAAEYDAAGRIMARGFMDELDKLAQTKVEFGKPKQVTAPPSKIMQGGPSAAVQGMVKKRKPPKSTQLPGVPSR